MSRLWQRAVYTIPPLRAQPNREWEMLRGERERLERKEHGSAVLVTLGVELGHGSPLICPALYFSARLLFQPGHFLLKRAHSGQPVLLRVCGLGALESQDDAAHYPSVTSILQSVSAKW